MISKIICVLAIAGVAFAHVPAKRSADAADSSSSNSTASGATAQSSGIAIGAWVDVQAQVSAALGSSDHSSCLGLLGLGNVKEQLEKIDYKKITVVEEVPDLSSVNTLPVLLGLQANIALARQHAVDAICKTANVTVDATLSVDAQVKAAVHAAILVAIEAASPVTLLIEIVYNIIKAYFLVALECPLFIASPSVVAEGISLASSCITVVINASVNVSL